MTTHAALVMPKDLTTPPHRTRGVRWLLLGVAVAFVGVLVLLPLVVVFQQAFSSGLRVYGSNIMDAETLRAVRLSLFTALVCVPMNVAFGVAAAWLLSRYSFGGRGLLLTLIDLPFSVSPVIAGLLFVLLFGRHGVLGPVLESAHIKVIFAVPGIIMATTFVTFPFVVRELLPVMGSSGVAQEEAAMTLGATGWQVLWKVTLPKVKWGLLYGVVLCNARAVGEFGAVSVVSGHIRGETNTIPLHVEVLYNEYNFAGAFAVASLLTLLALGTLVLKKVVEHRQGYAP